MIVSNVGGERKAASMVKDSKFYIDLAKFVQAYSMIISNPNEFLSEVGEKPIDPKTDFLTWEQFVKIMQKCELGFEEPPTETDLIVLYNYALEIGSISETSKQVADVEDVANAQKHYYNFVDESTEKAQMALERQKEIYENRNREAKEVDGRLSALKAKNIVALTFMTIGVLVFLFGMISLFIDNPLAATLGKIIPIWKPNYIGGFIFMILGIILFSALNGVYLKTKYSYLRLKDASAPIFKRSNSAYDDVLVLKDKFNLFKEDLEVVKKEIDDKEKTFDVTANIEKLASTNKYYQKFAKIDFSKAAEENDKVLGSEEELAPQKLSKDEYENVRTIGKEVITFGDDEEEEMIQTTPISDAEKEEANESEEVYGEFVGEMSDQQVLNVSENQNLKEIEREENEEKTKKEEEKDKKDKDFEDALDEVNKIFDF